ncbi:hypothetical protein KBP30_16120 [Streptomyces sp. Go40/10]|nr:hypothetical protein [Streptomyces sp. Go40/10]UFR02613.1 hypothetical protein KBP30_16120 [Streptomyces sp. Go40/10]
MGPVRGLRSADGRGGVQVLWEAMEGFAGAGIEMMRDFVHHMIKEL